MTRSPHSFRWVFRICLAGSMAMVVAVIRRWGAAEVRANVGEMFFLSILGCVWLLLSKGVFSWLGLSVRDDAVERKNPAALVGLCGAVVAVALTYAAGNLGEGPSYWNNVFSAGLGTGGLFGLWLLLELAG